MIVYVDTSAYLKLVIEEAESIELERFVDDLDPDDVVVSSALIVVEFGRAARRAGVFVHDIDRALARVTQVAITAERLGEAATTQPRSLRSLDAVHLATARHVGADAVVVYDTKLSEAARDAGFEVVQPGRPPHEPGTE